MNQISIVLLHIFFFPFESCVFGVSACKLIFRKLLCIVLSEVARGLSFQLTLELRTLNNMRLKECNYL